jgi:hypothetical protein
MNSIVFIAAVIVFLLSISGLLVSPFLVGTQRKPYDGNVVIANMIEFVLMLFICGRVFGWF